VSERVKFDDDPFFETHKKPPGEEFENRKSLDSIPPEFMNAIMEGINAGLMSGRLMGYPVINVKVDILDG
jgi:translation elongation factor EF-G